MALNVYNLYEKCKVLLDTNGNGWSDPINDFSKFSFKIEPLIVSKHDKGDEDDEMKACVNLMLNQGDEDNDEDMLVSLPKMETEENEQLATIWLPLKRKHIFNLNSKNSAFILFRYFVAVSKCYNYQGVSQVAFNHKLRQWIIDKILPYLDDERLYPAFGAVLRILETVKQPQEPDYRGSKRKHNYPKSIVSNNSSDESEEVSTGILDRLFSNHQREQYGVEDNSDEHNDHIKKIIQYSIIGLGAVLFLIIAMICICKTAKNRGNTKKENSRKKPKKLSNKSSDSSRSILKEKFFDVFRRPGDHDDSDYYHKKEDVSALKSSHVMFENEHEGSSGGSLRKSKQRLSQKPLMLPIVDSESDSDGEYMTHKMDLSGHNSKNTGDQGLYRISEESEGSRASSKHKLSRDTTRTKSQSSNFFSKLKRAKSPSAPKTTRQSKAFNASGSG